MEVTKFASKSCVKCKVLDNYIKQAGLTNVNVIYSEDNDEEFKKNNVTTVPTLLLQNGDKKEYLEGIVSPAMIKEAVERIG